MWAGENTDPSPDLGLQDLRIVFGSEEIILHSAAGPKPAVLERELKMQTRLSGRKMPGQPPVRSAKNYGRYAAEIGLVLRTNPGGLE